ncbi:cbb3-type cytochrome c oxidase subunit II [Verrucomicrobiales bacterium]|nr:cbb3-type cytochrome c oxidase subunit II [Verrucomicrobiales bacterium]MDA7926511.1 cbb3-type cytochrome c oxidase subunit II [Verrucomicrobiales bacterium]MDB4358967.1 cbb3-type cytochrome c oxidase subunit II [Verrucomicrobiales bacterium]
MSSNKFWKLLGALGVVFALPWLFLIVIPFIKMSNAKPVPYTEADGVEGIAAYPDKALQRHGSSDYGRQIYAAEGCAYCHTQVVRPTYAGPDMWRPGWGGREEEGLARETHPGDYATEKVAMLGYQRIGQDLSNVGHRIKSREVMHQHLADPRGLDPDSGMPAYKHLYKKSSIDDGYVPTGKAEALVDYLMSLKKDQKIPSAVVSGS